MMMLTNQVFELEIEIYLICNLEKKGKDKFSMQNV